MFLDSDQKCFVGWCQVSSKSFYYWLFPFGWNW